ncbi:hypothetical protein BJY04DRAFT_178427 [Aspergillus karnatakaensis]|uniref:uncharacterized protein n=1 Tax=Aspergillus karnatakaensis TaxID=1810916 RepID=UPI003CCE060A
MHGSSAGHEPLHVSSTPKRCNGARPTPTLCQLNRALSHCSELLSPQPVPQFSPTHRASRVGHFAYCLGSGCVASFL